MRQINLRNSSIRFDYCWFVKAGTKAEVVDEIILHLKGIAGVCKLNLVIELEEVQLYYSDRF